MKQPKVELVIQNSYKYHSYDGSHLHFKSANKLSVYLAGQVKKHLK